MNLRQWLGIVPSEDDSPRNGPLSHIGEWHAVGIGAAVGFIVAIVGGKDAAWLFIILTTIAIGGREVNVGHLKDVKNEPAWALVSAVAAFLVTAQWIVPQLSNGII